MTPVEVLRPAPEMTSLHRANTVFRVLLACNVVLTAYWVVTQFTGHSAFYGGYQLTVSSVLAVLDVLVFGTLGWGLIWHGVKNLLLAKVVGMTSEDRKLVASSRMHHKFSVAEMTRRYSERRIRIIDMIGRRGRTFALALASFYHLYQHIAVSPSNDFVTLFLGDQLLDAVVTGWVFIAAYRADGIVGAALYGSQTRIMDGTLARANCLMSINLWTLFKFILVPLGLALAPLYEPQHFAIIFALIWGAYLVTDAAAEIGGSLYGRQTIKVIGLGDLNRKSVGGTVTGFIVGLTFCLGIILTNGLGGVWILLAVMIAANSTVLELISPRSTDDFSIATGNALICWVFGMFIF